jgi:ferredoxin-NADP reductase
VQQSFCPAEFTYLGRCPDVMASDSILRSAEKRQLQSHRKPAEGRGRLDPARWLSPLRASLIRNFFPCRPTPFMPAVFVTVRCMSRRHTGATVINSSQEGYGRVNVLFSRGAYTEVFI